MSIDRMTRVNALLKREIGDALFAIMHEEAFDLSAVSITHVVASRSLREARVLVSIRGHEGERDRLLGLLRKHRAELQQRINKDLGLKYTPRLSFELDTSVERGDHVLSVLFAMDRADAQAQGDAAGGPSAAANGGSPPQA